MRARPFGSVRPPTPSHMLPQLLLTLVSLDPASSGFTSIEMPRSAELQSSSALAEQNPPPKEKPPSAEEVEYEKRRKVADNDTDKLWDLYDWCGTKKLDKQAKSCLRRIAQLKPSDEKSNRLLGNLQYDGKWFPSQAKIDEYKKEQDAKAAKELEKQAKENGQAVYKGQLVPAGDVAFLEKGLVKDNKGEWVNAEDAKKLKDGWLKQDTTWVAPNEKENIEKGLWKCGDKWLSLAEANDYHKELWQWWQIPGKHYTLWTTCERKLDTEKVLKNLDLACDDLEKCYGYTPQTPPQVIILRDKAAYESFAAGDQDEQRPPTESHGLSSVHYAFFADVAVDPVSEELVQCGVSYWDDSSTEEQRWSLLRTRHALGQSFGEAVDPSPKANEKAKKDRKFDAKAFYDEKRVPTWFRWGSAAYAERYFTDITVVQGGDAYWARKWSTQNIAGRGGLRPLKQVFEHEPKNENGEDTQKWINESGLMLAFCVDGRCQPVSDRLKALQQALLAGKDKKEITTLANQLQEEIGKHETDLRKFASL